MLVDIVDGCIQITADRDDLQPRHKSQLYVWGFEKNDETTYKNHFIDIDQLKQILEFIKGIAKSNLLIGEQVNNILKADREAKEIFNSIKQKARRFKDGLLDENTIEDFQIFLKRHIPRKLKTHQINAFMHMSIIGNGANFSVPGSGKTSVVLAHYEKLRLEGKVNILFVVGPTACFAPWKYEFEAVFNRKPRSIILAGGDLQARKEEYYRSHDFFDLYLASFQTLLNDKNEIEFLFKNKNVKIYFVVDEAHYLKKIDGQWASAVLALANHSIYRCALTGTPIPKNYSDLYNTFDFLWPGINPISSSDRLILDGLEENEQYEKAKNLLDNEIGPLFYRVRKSDLNLKPQIFHDPFMIEMNKLEKQIYDAIITKIRNYARDDFLENIDLVNRLRRGRMIRLRQCVSNTGLLRTALPEYDSLEDLGFNNEDLGRIILKYDQLEIPAKVEFLIELIKKFSESNEKVVIWSNFVNSVKFIDKKILEQGINCKIIIGEVPTERVSNDIEISREYIIREFVDPSSSLEVLIANPAACAESVSLHKSCQSAIYYDLSYNGAQYLQSLDRIHRVGGSEDKESNYYYLLYNNTIDPAILQNLNKKAQKMYDIVETDYSIYSFDMFESDFDSDIDAFSALFG